MASLILTPRFTDDAQALWRAATRLGWGVHRLTTWRVPEEVRAIPDPVLYLEGLFGPTLADQFGLHLVEPPIDWLCCLPEEYRKREIYLTTLGQARSLVELAFTKPPNEKSFPARTYRGVELPREFDDAMPVLVSEVVTWEREFRCFVLDREPRTISVYLRAGLLQRAFDFAQSEQEEIEARSFLQKMLGDTRVELPRATVLDVGVITDRGWAVVEQNAAWGSGIYGCDPEQVLEVLRFSAERS